MACDSRGPYSWLAPGQCTRCYAIFDSGPVEVVARYADCTVFKCPSCGASIDDRPIGWGGSFKPMTADEAADRLMGFWEPRMYR